MLSEKGATLMELVVVVAVAAIVVGALVFATIASLRNASFSKNQAQATKLAQEGIERVRAGRDRNALISNVPDHSDCPQLDSWNGVRAGSMWGCKIYKTCISSAVGSACYFKFANQSDGALKSLGGSATFPDTVAEQIPPSVGVFKRVIILSDDAATYDSQKTVTVVVKWTDFSGSHESRLTTILRKI